MLVSDAMKKTGLTRPSLIRYIDKGQIRAERKTDQYGQDYYEIDEESFDRWYEEWREKNGLG
jgi:hypothetical protein